MLLGSPSARDIRRTAVTSASLARQLSVTGTLSCERTGSKFSRITTLAFVVLVRPCLGVPIRKPRRRSVASRLPSLLDYPDITASLPGRHGTVIDTRRESCNRGGCCDATRGPPLTSPPRSSLRHGVDGGRVVREAIVVRLTLLGGFELRCGRQVVRVPQHVQRLLAFLGLHKRPLRRAYVAGRLWIDVSQEQAFGSLRTTLWRTRKVRAPVVVATSTHLALASSVAVDVRALEASAQRALHGLTPLGSAEVDLLTESDELLPDWYDDWVALEREQLAQLRLRALEAACEGLVVAGRLREATAAALAAITADPLRERARLLLISAYFETGDRVEARRQFVDFRDRLKSELDLEPSPQMLELVHALG